MNSVKKKASRLSIFEAYSSSLVLAPKAYMFDNKALRAERLLFLKKKKKLTNELGNLKENSEQIGEIPILVAF